MCHKETKLQHFASKNATHSLIFFYNGPTMQDFRVIQALASYSLFHSYFCFVVILLLLLLLSLLTTILLLKLLFLSLEFLSFLYYISSN